MAEVKAIDNLVAARTLLTTNLQNSRAMASDLDKTGKRLEEMRQRLPSLEAARNTLLQKCRFSAIKDHIDRAVYPAMAVLKVCKAIQELEKSLISDSPRPDLSAYLLLITQFEQALKFLSDNCSLAIQWLEGILQFLEEEKVANGLYVFRVEMSLTILQEFQATEARARVSGGILGLAFDKLKIEFKQLLADNSIPVAFPSFNDKQACIAPSPLSVAVTQKLQAIVGKLSDRDRLDWCLSAYAEVRSRNARRSLEALDLNYLNKSVTESDDVQDIEGFIYLWCEHLEFAVKHVFKIEYELCNKVFDKVESNVWMGCFAKIATQSGILSFLSFGTRVTECKKDPVKLLKLLDMFSCLDNIRAVFNRLFTGEACQKIQNLTKNLVKKVICGACEILWELPFQVELQRERSPPSDGSVPRLVRFVTEYCNHLLSEDYNSFLIKVLTIYQSWKNEKHQETLSNQINLIIKELCLNLDTWSQTYEDKALSFLFMMNNHSHFCNLKGTKVGELMGISWVRGHQQYKDYYMTLYLKETWGRILGLLNEDQQQNKYLSSPTTDSVKNILKAFNEALDGMYEKQSNWAVPDEELRLKMCRVAVQAFVPVYRSYLQNFMDLDQEDVRYTAQGLESMLSSLFQPKIRMYGGTKQSHWIDEVKIVEVDHFTLMAA
ncbi:protein binding protein, putative [Ricinus communis]|uniref:Exocyst subunit Exo70 family protein n=2 Tax=Ricinus communis TaxID=3988 RepID=B9SQM4_RICCO|nr:protein binding protein, putative [Ricinus communis]|eukprot:XP_002528293.1 exocyst complex component EXO70A1 [Ricinus communis]